MDKNFPLSEKASYLKKFRRTGEPGFSLAETARNLGLPPKKEILETLLKIGQLDPGLIRALDEKKIHLSLLPGLIKKSRTDQRQLAQMIFAFPLNANTFSEFRELLEEISRREKMKIAAIIDKMGILEIAAENSPADTRIKKARRELMFRRFPVLASYLDRLEKIKKNHHLPPNFQLTEPVFFEGGPWQINFKFKNSSELDHLIQILKELAADEQLKRFFKEVS